MSDEIHIIWNPSAGPAGPGPEARQHLDRILGNGLHVTETRSSEEASETVRAAADDAKLIVAAGGDGTINTVINALMDCPRRPTLGLLPLGTGNNLCRTLDIPLEIVAAIDVLRTELVRTIDLAVVEHEGRCTYYASVASGGNSDRVVECLTTQDKERWGPWCYVRSALPIVAELTGFQSRIAFDDGQVEQHRLWNVLVANGRLAAGGLPVAPRAEIDDGLLDVVLILDGSPLDFASLASEFFLADYLEHERVLYRRAKSLQVEAEPELRFLADGEFMTGQPFRFSIEPRCLQVVVGGGEEHPLGYFG